MSYPIIKVEISKTRGVNGSYIDSEGNCLSVKFPDNLYIQGYKYITDGKNVVKCKDFKIATVPSEMYGLLHFFIRMFGILNPFCEHVLYKNGGIVKYGLDLYLIQDTPKDGVVKAFNLTRNESVKIDIYDVGYYIHPHVAKMYMLIWSLMNKFSPGKYSEQDITEDKSNLLNIFSTMGEEEYVSIVKHLSEFDETTKNKLLKAASLLASDEKSDAFDEIDDLIKNEKIGEIVKDNLVTTLDLLKALNKNK